MQIGDKVVIKECHKMPDLVGKEGKIIAAADPKYVGEGDYPFIVELIDAVEMETPMGKLQFTGPVGFREDELELADPTKGIPDAFLKEG